MMTEPVPEQQALDGINLASGPSSTSNLAQLEGHGADFRKATHVSLGRDGQTTARSSLEVNVDSKYEQRSDMLASVSNKGPQDLWRERQKWRKLIENGKVLAGWEVGRTVRSTWTST
jgi:hypothetical protein